MSEERGEPAEAWRRPEPDAPREEGAARGAAGPVVLEARDVERSYGRKRVLAGISLELRAGEAVTILGHRNAGKSVLSRVLAGMTPPDRGSVRVTSPVAPLVGGPMGFGTTSSVERDLGLRAAAYGISTRDHIADIAALLDDPGVLGQPFNELDANSRVLLTYGASYMTPSDVYIVDGFPVPQVPTARARIAALFRAVRRRAAVLWLMSSAGQLRGMRPDRYLMLEGGQLHPLDGIDAAEALFLPRRAHGGAVPVVDCEEYDDTDD